MTAPALLPLAEVDALEAATRANLSDAIGNLARLRELGAHILRGHDSWHGYVTDRFGDLIARLSWTGANKAERLAIVDSMTGDGLTVREIAERLGVSKSVIQNDRRDLRLVHDGEPAEAPAGPLWEQAADVARRRGPRGVTLVELARALSITEGSASGLLTYLGPADPRHPQRKGLLGRTEERRKGQRVHLWAGDQEATSA